MAIDEALLDSYIENNTPSVLRLYTWQNPTLSIGRNQKIEEINIFKCQEMNIDVVRRPTGGKAVLHQGEITYSIISGKKDDMPNEIFGSYLEISKALIYSLKKLKGSLDFSIGDEPSSKYFDNTFCFASSTISDLNYLGKKFVGSAQLRRNDSFLQHGSILINQDYTNLKEIFNNQITDLVNLDDILGFNTSYQMIKNCILEGFKEFFKIKLNNDCLSKYEESLAKSYCSKYKKL